MRLVGAERGRIGIKEKYQDVIDLVQSKCSGGDRGGRRFATPIRPATNSSWSTTCCGG